MAEERKAIKKLEEELSNQRAAESEKSQVTPAKLADSAIMLEEACEMVKS